MKGSPTDSQGVFQGGAAVSAAPTKMIVPSVLLVQRRPLHPLKLHLCASVQSVGDAPHQDNLWEVCAIYRTFSRTQRTPTYLVRSVSTMPR